jgi:hypothetical protein
VGCRLVEQQKVSILQCQLRQRQTPALTTRKHLDLLENVVTTERVLSQVVTRLMRQPRRLGTENLLEHGPSRIQPLVSLGKVADGQARAKNHLRHRPDVAENRPEKSDFLALLDRSAQHNPSAAARCPARGRSIGKANLHGPYDQVPGRAAGRRFRRSWRDHAGGWRGRVAPPGNVPWTGCLFDTQRAQFAVATASTPNCSMANTVRVSFRVCPLPAVYSGPRCAFDVLHLGQQRACLRRTTRSGGSTTRSLA